MSQQFTMTTQGPHASKIMAVERPNDIYKFITLLPKDYCLIPGNRVIETCCVPLFYRLKTPQINIVTRVLHFSYIHVIFDTFA